jgi:hypothetical protein
MVIGAVVCGLAPNAFAFQNNVFPVQSTPALQRAIPFASPSRVILWDFIEWKYLDIYRLCDAHWIGVSVKLLSKDRQYSAATWHRLDMTTVAIWSPS